MLAAARDCAKVCPEGRVTDVESHAPAFEWVVNRSARVNAPSSPEVVVAETTGTSRLPQQTAFPSSSFRTPHTKASPAVMDLKVMRAFEL